MSATRRLLNAARPSLLDKGMANGRCPQALRRDHSADAAEPATVATSEKEAVAATGAARQRTGRGTPRATYVKHPTRRRQPAALIDVANFVAEDGLQRPVRKNPHQPPHHRAIGFAQRLRRRLRRARASTSARGPHEHRQNDEHQPNRQLPPHSSQSNEAEPVPVGVERLVLFRRQPRGASRPVSTGKVKRNPCRDGL